MIVFDLKCTQTHVFEAWFGSSADYEDQRTRGLLACPICGDADIAKAVMAPNIPAKSNRASAAPTAAPDPKALMAALAQVQAKMLEGSKWVGMSFADKARAMHAGEETTAPIHGKASLAEAKALIEDGIPVAPLPLPVIPPDQRN
ncbi:DUF1178 family protein [Sphingomonas sp. R647]|uniref:DUF1178 family protein n=1 Tax=Sphingomonas sp. R647 TaxID=2875233 RepID=UPI001CD241AE|nr:DUF1178 family protein [Sphingomonas sp. R647]MCA1198871.1 DUF1178 family protein [Sphingomonas sp. R647]